MHDVYSCVCLLRIILRSLLCVLAVSSSLCAYCDSFRMRLLWVPFSMLLWVLCASFGPFLYRLEIGSKEKSHNLIALSHFPLVEKNHIVRLLRRPPGRVTKFGFTWLFLDLMKLSFYGEFENTFLFNFVYFLGLNKINRKESIKSK